jgi:Fe-Mn family superoxide dismutase
LVQQEYVDLPGVGVEEVREMVSSGKPVQQIDVRPRFYVSRTQDIADGATWRDPERIDEWISGLSKTDPVIVYCAYGFHVGCNTTVKLREAGFDARYMRPGHSGWKAAGGPIKMHV